MNIRALIKPAATAMALLLMANGALADKVLKLGTVGRLGMPIGDAIDQAFIPTLEKVSGGKLKVEPHYRGSLCGEQTCGEQANQGLLQLWTSSTANFGSFGTELAIFDLPYIFKSIEDADRISREWLSDRQCKLAAETTGHVCLVVYSSGGFRQLGNAQRPVHVPSDMEGIKWRVTKSPIEYTLIKNWGAVPVPYDWTQLYQGLQTGVVSGQYVAVPWQHIAKLNEVAKYFTEIGGANRGGHVAVPWQHIAKLNEVAKYFTEIGGAWSGNQLAMEYNALTDEEKEWLHIAAKAFGDRVSELDRQWVADGEEAIKGSIEEWYVPTDDELSMWRQGAISAWLDAKGTFDPEVAERILKDQGMDDFIAQLKEAGAL